MKKHSAEEIIQKLAHAEALAQAGKSQVEICKDLGVSVMTLHRWRKLPLPDKTAVPASGAGPGVPQSTAELRRMLEELTLENHRLRKIVTDLLLEKMQIEEASSAMVSSRGHDRPKEP